MSGFIRPLEPERAAELAEERIEDAEAEEAEPEGGQPSAEPHQVAEEAARLEVPTKDDSESPD